jgi:hypothetical protein
MPVLRGRAVDEEQKLLVALVDDLERRSRLDVDQTARSDLPALGRVIEVHRERAADDDERLLLEHVLVPTPLRARLVAPEIRPAVPEAGAIAQSRYVALGFARLGRARRPLDVIRADHPVAHAVESREELETRSRLVNSD